MALVAGMGQGTLALVILGRVYVSLLVCTEKACAWKDNKRPAGGAEHNPAACVVKAIAPSKGRRRRAPQPGSPTHLDPHPLSGAHTLSPPQRRRSIALVMAFVGARSPKPVVLVAPAVLLVALPLLILWFADKADENAEADRLPDWAESWQTAWLGAASAVMLAAGAGGAAVVALQALKTKVEGRPLNQRRDVMMGK